MYDLIQYYVIRKPGHAYWSRHRSLAAALKKLPRANAQAGPGHRIYARHRSGNMTGPYDTNPFANRKPVRRNALITKRELSALRSILRRHAPKRKAAKR